MTEGTATHIGDGIQQTLARLTSALDDSYFAQVTGACILLKNSILRGRKLLIFGNGGSAADAQHIAAELVGRYKVERAGLPAIALTTDTSILTAWSNDYDFESVFARQVEAIGRAGDVAWGISTSGNSPNVVRAFESARRNGLVTLGLLGRDGGKAATLTDCAIIAPLAETDQIQVAHLLTYHAICAELDCVFN